MKNIQELVALSQQLSAVMDDIGEYEVTEVSVGWNGRARIMVNPEMFYESFKGFEIKVLENRRYKFRLSKMIQGVEFATLVNDLRGLKTLEVIGRKGVIRGNKKVQSHGNAVGQVRNKQYLDYPRLHPKSQGGD